MKQLLGILVLTFGLGCSSFPQKADTYKLEKLYQPEVSGKTFQVWKNDRLLIPVRYDSKNRSAVTFSYTGPKADVVLYRLHEVWADFSAGNCGEAKTSGTFEKIQIPDRVEKVENGKFEPLTDQQWLLVEVEPTANSAKGAQPFSFKFSQQGKTTKINGTVNVMDRTLENLSTSEFHSDFWQFPMAVADYYKIKPWSENHWKELATMFDQLKAINQNAVTTAVFWDLYNTRIRPVEEMMIQVRKNRNGGFTYDYTNFDRYITMAFQKGINSQIAIHNLFPWNNTMFFFDEAKAEVVSIQSQPDTPAYQSFWKPLILDLSKHLKAKGWLGKSLFYIDERDPTQTQDLIKWVKSFAPEFKYGYAGDFYPTLSPLIKDYAVPMNVVIEPAEMNDRILNAQETSLYTSCFEKENQPNMLLTSDLRNIYFLTQLAKAKEYEGVLRWAFNLWSADIQSSAIYSDVPSGDAHLVYPDGQVSLRYLVLLDALEEIAKLNMISKTKGTAEMMDATNRYFLINVEGGRYEMVEAMKSYLNDKE